MVSFRAFCVLALSTLMLAACAVSPDVQLYPGDKRPADQVMTVRVPSQLHVYTINGKKVKGIDTFFSAGYKDLKLTPGRYVVIAYYDELWNTSADEHEIYKSDPVKFIVDGKGGDHFKLGYKKPQNPDQAEKLANHFTGWTENLATDEKTPTQPSGLVLERGIFSSITGATVEKANADNSQSPGEDTVAPQGQAAKAAPAPAPATAQSASADNTVQPAPAPGSAAPKAAPSGSYLDTLKAEWNQATAKERREFLQWISNSK